MKQTTKSKKSGREKVKERKIKRIQMKKKERKRKKDILKKAKKGVIDRKVQITSNDDVLYV